MRIKYLRENFRRDFFQFGGLSIGGRSERDRDGTSAAGNDPGGRWAQAGRGCFRGGLLSCVAEDSTTAHRHRQHSTTTGIGSRTGPADNPRRGRRVASSTTDGQWERPTPAPGPAAEVTQDSGNGLQEGRAEGFYAHGIKFIPNLSTAPL